MTSSPVVTAPAAPRRRRFERPNFWTLAGLPGIVYLIAVFGIPLVFIVVRSLTDPSPANYAAVVEDPLYSASLWRTVQIAFLVTVLSLAIGYPLAYAMARSGKRLAMVLGAALLLSFWTSLLVRTFAWQVILNNTGLVNQFLLGTGIIDEPIPLIRNLFAVLVGMVHILIPYAVLAIYASLRGIKPEVEQAAQSLGASPWRVFTRVTLPLSLPGVAAGGILVFVLSLGFYITPALLGGPGDILISQSVVLQVQQYLQPGMGAAMAVVLVALVLLVFVIATRFIGLGRILGVTGAPGGESR
ncbi:ABC transporter permease [Ruicaihuangia caeni]|uniref:ABC transporter permease n=1 Tax=Ruicaihuangia caeni TaxID=3042517 RepID=A0AAW6T3E3_9MICO|nr:ABC transporter permease [Klugiella sp. YN-L-19]MDI2097621.1 ABC transporter permease [Klugiella sp. YN-L-19]